MSNTQIKHSFATNAVVTDANVFWRLYLCTHDIWCALYYTPTCISVMFLHTEKHFHNDVHTLRVSCPLCTHCTRTCIRYKLRLSDYCSSSIAVWDGQNSSASSCSIGLQSGFSIGSAYLKTLVRRYSPSIQSHVAECQQQMTEQPDDTLWLDKHPNKTKQFVLTLFQQKLFVTYSYTIVTCISDYRRGLDWWIDLLIIHRS
jgi:hypothetical protein